MQCNTIQYHVEQYKTIHHSDSDSDSDSDCLTSKVSLCGMRRQMRMPDPLHGVLEAITYRTFLSVVSLGRLAQECSLRYAKNILVWNTIPGGQLCMPDPLYEVLRGDHIPHDFNRGFSGKRIPFLFSTQAPRTVQAFLHSRARTPDLWFVRQ